MLNNGKIQNLSRLCLPIAVVVALWLVGCAKPDLHYSPAKGDDRSVSLSGRTAKQLYQYYNDWRHVRYRYGGLSKKGIDCSGLVFNAYHTLFNIKLPRTVA